MSNVLPFALRLRTHAEPGHQSRVIGMLKVSSDGRVRAESLDAELQPYLSDMAEKFNRRVLSVSMMGPDARGRFDSFNHLVEHDDPEFAEALMLRVEGEYGLVVEQAA